MTPRRILRRAPLALAMAATMLATVAATSTHQQDAAALAAVLPLGGRDLPEVRNVTSLARGVQLTQIVRGANPASPAEIPTTSRGPWRVSVLTVDPKRARGHLKATYGKDLAQVEATSDLVRAAGALGGVNASFFAIGSKAHPGEPVGLGLYRGAVHSEPAAVSTEVNLLVDARTNKVRIGRLTWSGSLSNRSTRKTVRLDHLNRPPQVPVTCRQLLDPTTCTKSGDVVHFRQQFGPTPVGPGIEVVLNRSGCLVRSTRTRGTVLTKGQSSVQATGSDTRTLLALVKKGCLSRRVALRDDQRKTVRLHPDMYGVAGRYRLTRNGRIVVPAAKNSFFARHPRTLVGATSSGKVLLVTIDGRRTTSVGATLAESAAVAHALGLRNSVNLDGGGSTSMAVKGAVVNQPSGGAQRAVGDALVYVDRPLK
ncbi:MAG TPA: phosphodiester glycosidase family protein [Propionibacteriaceae bacterium]|nr:phosphodiester glycosidase family protein [Propionibacteriaceae bacterium]